MSAVQTLRDALFGNPPVAGFKPDQAGVLAAFIEMQSQFESLNLGIDSYANVAALPVVTVADNGKSARVFADAVATNNTFWIVKAGTWVIDTDLVNILVGVAREWADNPENDEVTGAPGGFSAKHWSIKAQAALDKGRYVYCNRTGASNNNALVVVSDGGVAVTSYNEWQLYVFNVTGANTVDTPTLNINSLGVRNLRTASGGVLPLGYYEFGTHIACRYHASANEFRIIFMSPVPITQRSPFCVFTPSGGATNAFIGSITPLPLSDLTKTHFVHKVSALQSEGGVSYRIAQIVDEPRQLKNVANQQITPGTWAVGDTLLVRYRAEGWYELVAVLPGALSSANDAPEYDTRRAFYTMRNIQIAAIK